MENLKSQAREDRLAIRPQWILDTVWFIFETRYPPRDKAKDEFKRKVFRVPMVGGEVWKPRIPKDSEYRVTAGHKYRVVRD